MNKQPKQASSNGDVEVEIITPDSYPVKDFEAKHVTSHIWRQSGSYLICQTCEPVHASHIGTDFLLQGTDNKGEPILKRIETSA
jgi:hypothetical protein